MRPNPELADMFEELTPSNMTLDNEKSTCAGKAPLLILLVGIPGSGKSAWAYRNAKEAIIVSQDDLIDAITPSGFEYSARPIYAAAEEAIARCALRAGRVVIVDRTNRTRALRRRWIEIAQDARSAVVALTMRADTETCRARNRSRSGPRRVAETRMERMISIFETPDPDEGFDAVLGDQECPTLPDVQRVLHRIGAHNFLPWSSRNNLKSEY